MKKTLLALTLLLPIAIACSKSNPTETEMKLPTPVVSPTPIVAASASLIAIPTPTDTPALDYTIEDIKGTGLILTGDDTIPESVVEGESVEPGDELFTKDNSEMTLALNDNTLIHLSANSQVKVTDLTPNTTQGFSSRIQLLLGTILSEVEKLNESQSSFEIEAGGVVCGVRGTGFEVKKQGDFIGTKTYHGAVEMKKNGITQLVKENEHSTFNLKNSNFLPKRHLSQTEKKHYQNWVKTKKMVQKKRAARINGGIAPHRPHQKSQSATAEMNETHRSGKKLKTRQHAAHAANPKRNQAAHSIAKPQVRKPIPKKPQQRSVSRSVVKKKPSQKQQPRKNQPKRKRKDV